MPKHSKAHLQMMNLAQSFLMTRFYISLSWIRRRNKVTIPLRHVRLEEAG